MGVLVPLVFGLAALPIAILWVALRAIVATSRGWLRITVISAAGVALACCLAVVATSNYRAYFHQYRTQYLWSSENTYEVARALRAQGVPTSRMFFLAYPNWLDARLLSLALTSHFGWAGSNAVGPGVPAPRLQTGGRAVYALNKDDGAHRRELRRRFPDGRYVVVRSPQPGQDFGLYVVPG